MTLQERAMVLKALGHPARLAMVERLGQGECGVYDLKKVEMGGQRKLSGPTISQHLLVLKNAGIIADERRAQRVFYRLLMPCVTDILLCIGGSRKR